VTEARRETLSLRAASWLAKQAPMAVWRDVIALAACVLTVVCLCGGLITYWWPWAQFGLIGGIVVGLISSSIPRAALVAAAGTSLGLTIGPVSSAFFPPSTPDRIQFGLLSMVLAAAIAAGTRYILRITPASGRYLVMAVIALLAANLWMSSLSIAAQQTFNPMTQTVVPSMNEQIEGNVPPDFAGSDHVLYLRVYESIKAGQPYYQSFRKYFIEWSGGRAPNTVLNIRSPLLTYSWAALPGPRWMIYGFLALATVAMFLVPVTLSGLVRMPLAIPGSAALAAWFLYFPRQLPLLTTEAWAVMPALMSFAAMAASVRSDRWRTLTVVSAALAALSLAMRETLVFVMFAGFVSSVVVSWPQRRFRSAVWLGFSAAAFAALGANYWLARSVIDPDSGYQGFVRGGVSQMLLALTYATDHLGLGGWLAYLLAGLGLLGAALIPDVRLRVFVLVSVVAALVAFLFVGNVAADTRTGIGLNYWGVVVVPLLYTCIPLAFTLLPGAAPRRT